MPAIISSTTTINFLIKTGVPPSKSSEFGEFRLKASDLISDVIFIVGSNRCFENVCSR
jgi:hypothetical protein